MIKLKIDFIFFLISKLIFIQANLSSYSLGISDTLSFKGFFVRKVTPNKIYIGNLFEEKTYDLNTNTSEKYYKPCICGTGTACPLIVLDNNSNPTYSVSKKEEKIQIINLINNETQTDNFGYNMMGIYRFSENYALVGARRSDLGWFERASRGFRAILLTNISHYYTNDIPSNYELGFIHLKDSQLLIFSQYSYLEYAFIDKEVKFSGKIYANSCKTYGYYGYH